MSNRPLAVVAFVVASMLVSACSQLTVPHRDYDEEEGEFANCRTVLVGSGGRYCADDIDPDSVVH